MSAVVAKMLRRGVHSVLWRLGYKPADLRATELDAPYQDPAIEPEYRRLCDSIERSGFTPSKHEAVHYTAYCAIKYIVENDIPGDIVECGVHVGDKIVLMCSFLRSRGIENRRVYLYDTFSGMTAPTAKDRKIGATLSDVRDVVAKFEAGRKATHNEWCYASKEHVMHNVQTTGYSPTMIHPVEGDVRDTLPNELHSEIALLRLDTDFYESTMHELRHLYHRVVKGGVIIFDDYGGWQGQKDAADDFCRAERIFPFLVRTCRRERVFIKT